MFEFCFGVLEKKSNNVCRFIFIFLFININIFIEFKLNKSFYELLDSY